MKLYESMGPNPRMVNIFALEKGIDIERVQIDMIAGENRGDSFVKINSNGTCPALELDNGIVISEITAICEYLEELYPEENLIGNTPEERARVRMWCRRIDLKITEPLAIAVHSGEAFELFKGRMRLFPYSSEEFYAYANDGLEWLNKQMDGHRYIAGDRITMADINLFAHIDYYQHAGRPIEAKNTNLIAWHERMSARPSAAASLHEIDKLMRGIS